MPCWPLIWCFWFPAAAAGSQSQPWPTTCDCHLFQDCVAQWLTPIVWPSKWKVHWMRFWSRISVEIIHVKLHECLIVIWSVTFTNKKVHLSLVLFQDNSSRCFIGRAHHFTMDLLQLRECWRREKQEKNDFGWSWLFFRGDHVQDSTLIQGQVWYGLSLKAPALAVMCGVFVDAGQSSGVLQAFGPNLSFVVCSCWK